MASTRKASIAAELRADRAKFKQDLAGAKNDIKAFGDDARKAGGSFNPGGPPGTWSRFKENVGSVVGKYQHLRQAVTDVVAVGVRLAGAPAMYEDMTGGLEAVTGSAKEAAEAMDLIAGVAEKQKLEFEPLVEAYHNMRSLGYSAQQTRDFVTEMGNAVQAVGGDAAELAAVSDALIKIKDKSDVSAKGLENLGKSMPFLRTIMKEQFGSETAAEIDKLGLSSEELFDGIMRGLKRLESQEGSKKEALDPGYMASMARLEAGRRLAFESLGQTVMPIPDLAQRQVDSADPEGDAARIAAFRAREENKAKAAADEKAAAGMKELEQQEQILDAQKELQRAELQGNKENVALWEDRIAIMEKAADLAKDLGITEEQAAEALKRQNKLRRETAALAGSVRTPEQQNGMANSKEQAEIDRLRSRGKNKEADKRQKALDLAGETDRLTKEGFSAEDAAAMAAQGAQTKEDQEYLDRTGRNKMHGGKSKNLKTGIDGEFHSERFSFAAFQDQGMAYDFRQKVTPARNERDKASRGIKAGLGDAKVSSPEIGALFDMKDMLAQKLDQLINATTGTVADKTRPK